MKSLANLLILWAAVVVGCKKGPFTYDVHSATAHVLPLHDPLLPAVGDPLTIEVLVDTTASVSSVEATVLGAGFGNPSVPCAATSGGWWTCSAGVVAADELLLYSATARIGGSSIGSGGVQVDVGAAPGAARLTYAPLTPSKTSGDAQIDVLVAAMPSGGLAAPALLQDFRQVLRNDVFADPAWRKRFRLIRFHTTDQPAITSSYEVGRSTRCGQNPWPAEPGGPAAAAGMDVIAVVHRTGPATDGFEGGTTGFRDCAGSWLRDPDVATLSAHTEKAVFRHELGHAVLALGDEYHEPESSRRVDPEPPPAPTGACCCCNESTGGGPVVVPGGPGSGGVSQCLDPATGAFVTDGACGGFLPGGSSLPSCGTFVVPPQCYDAPIPTSSCPPLASGCVAAKHFLGGAPPSGTERWNVFPTLASCETARTRALSHPGVPDPTAGLDACRQICGPGTAQACPCVGAGVQAWIVDVSPNQSTNDAMAVSLPAPNHHGSTDRVCLETSLCVRWERARGETVADAWSACADP